MSTAIFNFCIYTIAHTERLREIERKGGKGSLTESKKWVTAQRLLNEAKQAHERMLLVFAPAESTDKLIYCATLDDIKIESDNNPSTTTYSFSKLTAFTKPLPKKTSLKLMSNGQPISVGFIRPYAVCRTPRFLLDKLQ